MNIKKAKTENFEDVKLITHETIKEIYPHYYPRGVVDFFLEHHNSENITKDILDSSLPAKDIYRKRGYIIIESHKIVTANEDVLCYDLMKKNTKA